MNQKPSPLHRASEWIVDHYRLFFVVFAALLVFSAVASGWVKVENDVAAYLPADSETRQGLDIMEHGLASGYADFMPATSLLTSVEAVPTVAVETPKVSVDDAVPVVVRSDKAPASDVKMTKVSILCKQSSFEVLKTAMEEIGVTGMTVSQVLGCGMQKGRPEYYRGVAVEMNLLPKVQVDIVVCKIPVRTVIDTAKKVLYSGHIGDGKIFVYDVENVIKVRTGEEGYDALQDVE